MKNRKFSRLVAFGLILATVMGNTIYAADSNIESDPVKNEARQGQVIDRTFPRLESSSSVVNNSAQTFKGYEGQGILYVTLDGVKEAKVYINGQPLAIDEILEVGEGDFKLDISEYVVNGDNALQIFDIQPQGATIQVDIPYPTLRTGKAEDVGIDKNVFEMIEALIEAEVEAKGIPGGQLVVVKDGLIIKNDVYGYVKAYDHEGEVEDGKEVTRTTLYDLASNTKMYTANYAIQKLVYEDKLDVDMKIDEVIPGFSEYDPMKQQLTIRHLLTHTGGFIPDPQYHNENYLHPTKVDGEAIHLLDKNEDGVNDVFTQNPKEMLEMVKKTPLEYTPGSKNVYSDVDYILLGMIVESVTGQDLETYCKVNLFDPLGLEHMMFNPLEKGMDKENIAATEMCGNTREGHITFENVRTEVVQGEVHDEKAYYAMGGVSGHAGLFGTAEELAILMQVMLNGGGYGDVKLFDQHTIDTFSTPSKTNATYALGWRRQGDDGYAWSFGEYAEDTTIGHTGWTGTSTSINLEEDLLIVWLTNTKNTPIADPEKSLHRMEGDAFQFDAAGTVSTLIYQGMIGASDEVLYDMLMQMVQDRIAFLKGEIQKDGNCTKADYLATHTLAELFIQQAEALGRSEDIAYVLEMLPEY